MLAADPPRNGSRSDEVAAQPPRRPRSRRRGGLSVLFGLVLVVVAWTLVAGLVAAHRLREVRTDVARLTSQPGDDRESLQRRLQADLRKVDSATSLLHQVGPRVFGWVPVVGRNVD